MTIGSNIKSKVVEENAEEQEVGQYKVYGSRWQSISDSFDPSSGLC